MNKVITINLGGNAYQLEENGYESLDAYLDTAAARLVQNPDREEILSDIEGAIAEKFRTVLNPGKNVVTLNEVQAALAQMGPVEADPETGGAAGASAPNPGAKADPADQSGPAADSPKPHRLYRVTDDAMIAGVCNGIAAYFNIDPTLVRLGFVLLTVFGGSGLIVYIIMAIVVPEARSPEEKAAAGQSWTAQEFIRRAKEGYYEAMKNFPDSRARREWHRQFRRRMRANRYWRRPYWQPWAGPGGGGPVTGGQPGVSFALPLLSLLAGAAVIAWICALISLLATGALFGVPLPGNVPVWVAALVLFFAYAILSGSLKMGRRFCFWTSNSGSSAASLVLLLDALVWLAVVATLLALAVHYFPELRQAVASIPNQAHQAANDVRDWWKGR